VGVGQGGEALGAAVVERRCFTKIKWSAIIVAYTKKGAV